MGGGQRDIYGPSPLQEFFRHHQLPKPSDDFMQVVDSYREKMVREVLVDDQIKQINEKLDLLLYFLAPSSKTLITGNAAVSVYENILRKDGVDPKE